MHDNQVRVNLRIHRGRLNLCKKRRQKALTRPPSIAESSFLVLFSQSAQISFILHKYRLYWILLFTEEGQAIKHLILKADIRATEFKDFTHEVKIKVVLISLIFDHISGHCGFLQANWTRRWAATLGTGSLHLQGEICSSVEMLRSHLVDIKGLDTLLHFWCYFKPSSHSASCKSSVQVGISNSNVVWRAHCLLQDSGFTATRTQSYRSHPNLQLGDMTSQIKYLTTNDRGWTIIRLIGQQILSLQWSLNVSSA